MTAVLRSTMRYCGGRVAHMCSNGRGLCAVYGGCPRHDARVASTLAGSVASPTTATPHTRDCCNSNLAQSSATSANDTTPRMRKQPCATTVAAVTRLSRQLQHFSSDAHEDGSALLRHADSSSSSSCALHDAASTRTDATSTRHAQCAWSSLSSPQPQPRRSVVGQRVRLATATQMTATSQQHEEQQLAPSSWCSQGNVCEDAVDDDDDDVVVTMPSSLRALAATETTTTAATERQKEEEDDDVRQGGNRRSRASTALTTSQSDDEVRMVLHSPHAHPSACGVGQDVIDLVTDAMRTQRERHVRRRRRILYELTHPRPEDYTYGTRRVPPPPLNFGVVTREAMALGAQLMLEQPYTLVRQAGLRISDADVPSLSVASVPGCAATSAAVTTDVTPARAAAAAAVVVAGAADATATPPRRHHGRKREANPFASHSFFFELNELYQEIVLVGRASAGKSSLLNALLGQRVAQTSSTPHTTRAISFYQSVTPAQLRAFCARERHNLVTLPGGGRQLTFVDVPGFGVEGMSEAWRDEVVALTDAYLGVRRSVNTVLFCVDCARGLTKTDMRYFRWLENVHGVFYVVLTKCDAVAHTRICAVMRQVYVLITRQRRKYRKVYPFVLPTSAKDGTNMDVLRGMIAETSGMLAGDRLRALLKRKQKAVMRTALRAEATRLQQARQLEREQARAYFAAAHTSNDDNDDKKKKQDTKKTEEQTTTTSTRTRDSDSARDAAADVTTAAATMHKTHEAHEGGSAVTTARVASSARATPSTMRVCTLTLRDDRHTRKRTRSAHAREDNDNNEDDDKASNDAHGDVPNAAVTHRLASRGTPSPQAAQTMYGAARYRVNTGLDSDVANTLTITYDTAARHNKPEHDDDDDDDGEKATLAPPPQELHGSVAAATTASRVIGLEPQLPSTSSHTTDTRVHHSNSNSSNNNTADDKDDDEAVTRGTATTMTRPCGVVSAFMDSLDRYAAHTNSAYARRRHGKARAGNDKTRSTSNMTQSSNNNNNNNTSGKKAADDGSRRRCASRLLVQGADGRLAEHTAGHVSGPALLSPRDDADSRHGVWRAHRLATLLRQADARAPWAALPQLARNADELARQDVAVGNTAGGGDERGRTRRPAAAVAGGGGGAHAQLEQWQPRTRRQQRRQRQAHARAEARAQAACERNSGRIVASFVRFEGEVSMRKYRTESRQAPTLRSQAQMHLNATARIGYNAMPAGLLKQYGQMDTHLPTPRVRGREHDESHRR